MDRETYRRQIDEIDREIVQLFIRRMDLCARIALYKQQHHLPILDEKREQDKLQKIAGQTPQELKEYSAALYSRLFELSRDYQERCISRT